MITVAVICFVLALLAAVLWPAPEPALVLLAIGIIAIAMRFLP